jgi:hypothetical protein
MKQVPLRLTCFCLALGVAYCSGKPRIHKPAIQTSTGSMIMQKDVFGMSSQDYFTNPGKGFSDVGYRMANAGQQGLLLGGPEYVAYDKDPRFAVSCLNVAEALDLRDYEFRTYALVAAVDAATGAFYADHLIEQKFKKEKMDPNASSPPPGISFDGSAGDLFARLEIPRHSAVYLITGILLDRSSNRIRIRVGSEVARTDIAKFTAEAEEGAKSPAPLQRLLRTRRVNQEPDSPPLPDVPGIKAAIVVPPKKPFASEDPLSMYVSYKLPFPSVTNGGKPATELTFHILGTGTRIETPSVVRAVVPILPANRAADGTLQGFFSVDVNQGNNLQGNQAYSFYLFSGEQLGAVPKVELP